MRQEVVKRPRCWSGTTTGIRWQTASGRTSSRPRTHSRREGRATQGCVKNGATPASTPLLFGSDSQGFHLAVKMAALQAEDFGGAGYVAVILIERFEDVVA